MNIDFVNEKYRFNARSSAIICNTDKTKVLLFNVGDDRDFYMLPGGRIMHFENSKDAIKREIKEELGWLLEYDFCCIQENFLETKGKKITQYNFCYKAIYDGKISNEPIKCHDNEYQSFKWVSLKELDNYKILPKSNKDLILENTNLFHMIERT